LAPRTSSTPCSRSTSERSRPALPAAAARCSPAARSRLKRRRAQRPQQRARGHHQRDDLLRRVDVGPGAADVRVTDQSAGSRCQDQASPGSERTHGRSQPLAPHVGWTPWGIRAHVSASSIVIRDGPACSRNRQTAQARHSRSHTIQRRRTAHSRQRFPQRAHASPAATAARLCAARRGPRARRPRSSSAGYGASPARSRPATRRCQHPARGGVTQLMRRDGPTRHAARPPHQTVDRVPGDRRLTSSSARTPLAARCAAMTQIVSQRLADIYGNGRRSRRPPCHAQHLTRPPVQIISPSRRPHRRKPSRTSNSTIA